MRLVSTVHGMETQYATENHQLEDGDFITSNNIIPTSRYDYFHKASSIDDVNRSIHDCYYSQRISRWRLTLIIWLFKALLHNTQILYQHLNQKNFTTKQFLEFFVSKLIGRNNNENNSLQLSNQINSIIKLSKHLSCRLCYQEKKITSSCRHYCTICQVPIHSSCGKDKEKHAQLIIYINNLVIKKVVISEFN